MRDHVAPSGDVGGDLASEAVALVRTWLADGERALSRADRRQMRQFRLLTGDQSSLAFTMAFCDRVLRPESDAVSAHQLAELAAGPSPAFLGPLDRALLGAGARLARAAPSVVMPLTRRRLRQIVGGLVVDRADRSLSRHLKQLREAGFAVNINLLGEAVLGDADAESRLLAVAALIARPDIDYVSVKASAVACQLNLWGYDRTLERVKIALRRLFEAAAVSDSTFLNLDMEEYRDLRLTVDAFTQLLDEPALRSLDAGIVLQAYLPDSFDVLRELVGWANQRRAGGGGEVKVRIVKGANLAMEAVDAAMHGWLPAPYATKAETDANYKRMLDWVLQPQLLQGVRLGVASHNLFDVAWVHLLAKARGVAARVEMEMLQGMAPGLARAVRDATGQVRLYTPVVAADDFDSALAYLFRRLEENSSGENFLRHIYDLGSDSAVFAAEQERFVAAVAARRQVASRPRRASALSRRPAGFANTPDSDPTGRLGRERVLAALTRYQPPGLPDEVSRTEQIDDVVAGARAAYAGWSETAPAMRSRLLRGVASQLASRRPELMALMAHEARKPVSEGDGEVSEAIDMAAYYAEHIPGARAGHEPEALFEPLGVVVVTPPWNFPLAITAGGVLAALAAGNAVILKAPPQTPRCAAAIAEAVWAACREQGVPTAVVHLVTCPEEVVGEHLIGHPGVAGIVLTGARETAGLFTRLAPETPLFAETSGKNALVVTPDADLDLAAADLIGSAFSHAGQKCSAASLGILVGDVYASPRFRRQLIDAASSLYLGPAEDPAVVLPPLIGQPGEALRRALTRLDPGEHWLLAPRLVDPERQMWTPGIKAGVRAGSWFHRTECFGPVLGLMAAADLTEALALQNATGFGLTGGIHSLDPTVVARWMREVEVGNAYVNRVITGAVVQRQPFGGWKGSVVGPGAKAGGPNYVAQLGKWRDVGLPARGIDPSPEIADWAELNGSLLSPAERAWLTAAVRSDAWWQLHEFGVEADPSGLFCEANVFRYRAFPRLVIRVETHARRGELLRAIAAARLAGGGLEVSAAADAEAADLVGIGVIRETVTTFLSRLRTSSPDRVRLLGHRPPELSRDALACYLDDRPVVADGGVEGLRYRREQAVSRTLHRFGNVVRTDVA